MNGAAPRPPIPPREPERLRALERLRILDTPPEESFDRLTRLAARVFSTPISLVSLLDAERQWFKSRFGLDTPWTRREISFCAYTIMGSVPMVVADASRDPRFADNPLVTGPPFIRFYAGAPLLTAGGHAIGTLCVIDRKPHKELDAVERQLLEDMADLVVERLEIRHVVQTLRDEAAEREQAERRLRAREEELARSLDVQRVLMREIHHRVKNNLQAIASIVQVESARQPLDSPARPILDAMAARIGVMFGIHQQLHSGGRIDRVDVGAEMHALADSLHDLHDGHLCLNIRAGSVECDPDTAMRLGLIAHELLVNAVKHATPDQSGAVTVDLMLERMPDGGIWLRVSNRAEPAPRAPPPQWPVDGTGSMLLEALAGQIGAALSRHRSGSDWAVDVRVPATVCPDTVKTGAGDKASH